MERAGLGRWQPLWGEEGVRRMAAGAGGVCSAEDPCSSKGLPPGAHRTVRLPRPRALVSPRRCTGTGGAQARDEQAQSCSILQPKKGYKG